MSVTIIIPARYASTRYPAKPLAQIRGKESILWTLEAGLRVQGARAVYVATDDDRIADVVRAAGGQVVMTSDACRNGTERVAEAARLLGLAGDEIIVNLQGDAPLTPSWFVDALIKEMHLNNQADMVTPVLKCDEDSYKRFKNDRAHGRVGATTAVFGAGLRALYFSKEVIPYLPAKYDYEQTPVYHHVGIYGYRMRALQDYPHWPVGPLESAEQLEQLRFLENGRAVYVVEVDARGHAFWELNNPEDVQVIEEMMTQNARIPAV